MKLLITGSRGLIGAALRDTLRLLGIETVGMDIQCEPHDEDYGDILDREKVREKMRGIDGVIHLAAVSRVIFGEKHPQLCWDTNVQGTKHILEAALEIPNHPWVIYASSREVYGQQKELPVKETAPLSPVNIYGESKIAAEKEVERAAKRGLKSSIVRFSNVFGRVNDHEDRVVPAFCRAAAEGLDIRVDGKENLFDFTYIDDVVSGMIAYISALVESPIPLPPIHFTTGKATSLGEIASYAKEVSSHEIEIREAPSRSFDVSTFCGDISQAKELLQWEACIDVKEGMNRLIHQFKLFSEVSKLLHA